MACLVAAAEAAPQAGTLKLYSLALAGHPRCRVVALSSDRLVVSDANPTDPYQQWEIKKVVSDNNSFELVNRGSGEAMKNVHILPRKLVVSAYYHPLLLGATARWKEAGGGPAADVDDGGIPISCVSVLSNPYLPLKIVPWGYQQQGNIEIGVQAADHEVIMEVVNDGDAGIVMGVQAADDEVVNEDAKASDGDYAVGGATATASTRNTI